MHREAWEFVKTVKAQAPEFFTGKKVLEVGSLNINGTVRDFFTDCDYTGIDLGSGPGVDKVCHVTEFSMLSRLYDVVISTEALEHDSQWLKSLKVMRALLKPNGILIITCAGPNRPEHGTRRTGNEIASPHTPDYYRNISTEDFAFVLPANLFSKSYLGYRGQMEDLYFVGIKPEAAHVCADQQMKITREWLERPPADGFVSSYEEAIADYHKTLNKVLFVPNLTVTAEVCTKGRYESTLGMCLAAILTQTRKPDRLVIYDDGEQKDLRTFQPFEGLLWMANDLGIPFTTFTTERKGQVACHQHCLDDAQTDVIFRVDDDIVLEPNVFEECLKVMEDGVGAVAPLIHHPGNVSPLPSHVTGKLSDVSLGLNIQWFSFNSGPREVEHLYSSFAVRVKALQESGGYPMNLSVVGHHEESIATHRMYRDGWKLIVTPAAKAYHLRASTGGIRSFSDTSLWEHDEQVWQQYLREWGAIQPETKLHILDCGLGDALCYRAVFLEYIHRKYPDRHYTLAVCQPEVFEDLPNVTIISIAEAKAIVGDRYEDYSLFAWCWKNDWKGSIVDAIKEFYGK